MGYGHLDGVSWVCFQLHAKARRFALFHEQRSCVSEDRLVVILFANCDDNGTHRRRTQNYRGLAIRRVDIITCAYR